MTTTALNSVALLPPAAQYLNDLLSNSSLLVQLSLSWDIHRLPLPQRGAELAGNEITMSGFTKFIGNEQDTPGPLP